MMVITTSNSIRVNAVRHEAPPATARPRDGAKLDELLVIDFIANSFNPTLAAEKAGLRQFWPGLPASYLSLPRSYKITVSHF
jgi:hypothetical protein